MEKKIAFDYTDEVKEKIEKMLKEELIKLDRKIVVLDDDPTGSQTVKNLTVYCDWEKETIKKAFNDKEKMFFILTNSRSFSEKKTLNVHKDIMNRILDVNEEQKFLIYSRGDSTLRGHYPLETEILKEIFEKRTSKKIDGEIICPFFLEGKRVTIDGVHYIVEKERTIPVAETEFSKDKSFSYVNSDLAKWCEEKSSKKYREENIVKISLEELRRVDVDGITKKLLDVKDFNKVIVDSTSYFELKVFVIAFLRALFKGKEFFVRGAASMLKVLADSKNDKLLEKKDIFNVEVSNGGLILVGSHVDKTTRQLEELKKTEIVQLEFNQHLVLHDREFFSEIERVKNEAKRYLEKGKDVVIYTKRERLDIPNGNEEEQLRMATKISDGLIEVVKRIGVRPRFLIAKGGITSSDTATKGLEIKQAKILGQIAPGVSVWLSGNDSRYYNLPYIIFPGNVGEDETLKEVYEILKK